MSYPNPFNSSTRISSYLHESSHVTLKIYNMAGAEVTTLVKKNQIACQH